jgi:hypothetical protein
MSYSPIALALVVGSLALWALWIPCVSFCRRFFRPMSRIELPVIVVLTCVLLPHGMALGQPKAVPSIASFAGSGGSRAMVDRPKRRH